MEEAEADLAGDRRADHRHACGWRRSSPPACTCSRPRCGGSRAEHPALRVEVTDAEPETSLPALALGTLDMVLADQYPFLPRPPDDRARPRAAAGGAASASCCPPTTRSPAAAGRSRSPRCATSRGRSARTTAHYAELTIRACRALGGFEPDVRHRSNDLLMLLALVANGQAVTLLPDLVRRRPRAVASSPATSPRRG